MVRVDPEHRPDLLGEAAVALGERERGEQHLVHKRQRVVVQLVLGRVGAHRGSALVLGADAERRLDDSGDRFSKKNSLSFCLKKGFVFGLGVPLRIMSSLHM